MGKLTARPPLTAVALDDLVHVVDVSDVSSGPQGSSKKATVSEIGSLFAGRQTVVVNDISQFPAPVGGIITLAANTTYVIGDNLNIGTFRLDASAGRIGLTCRSNIGPTLTYTGTSSMIFSTGGDVSVFDASIDCPNGKPFEASATVPGTGVFSVLFTRVLNCAGCGDFTDLLSVTFDTVTFFNVTGTEGIRLFGSSFTLLYLFKVFLQGTNAGLVAVDLGVAVSIAIEIISALVSAPGGAVGISGAAGSANLPPGSIGLLRDCRFVGGITPISGITQNDIRWLLDNNTGVADTRPDALISFVGNAIATTIGVAGTPVLLAGTWVTIGSSQFTCTAAGRITYDGEKPITEPVDIAVSIAPVSGSNKTVAIYLAKNGVVIASSRISAVLSNGGFQELSVPWQVSFTKNDYVELFVANITDTTSLLAQSAKMRVR